LAKYQNKSYPLAKTTNSHVSQNKTNRMNTLLLEYNVIFFLLLYVTLACGNVIIALRQSRSMRHTRNTRELLSHEEHER